MGYLLGKAWHGKGVVRKRGNEHLCVICVPDAALATWQMLTCLLRTSAMQKTILPPI